MNKKILLIVLGFSVALYAPEGKTHIEGSHLGESGDFSGDVFDRDTHMGDFGHEDQPMEPKDLRPEEPGESGDNDSRGLDSDISIESRDGVVDDDSNDSLIDVHSGRDEGGSRDTSGNDRPNEPTGGTDIRQSDGTSQRNSRISVSSGDKILTVESAKQIFNERSNQLKELTKNKSAVYAEYEQLSMSVESSLDGMDALLLEYQDKRQEALSTSDTNKAAVFDANIASIKKLQSQGENLNQSVQEAMTKRALSDPAKLYEQYGDVEKLVKLAVKSPKDSKLWWGKKGKLARASESLNNLAVVLEKAQKSYPDATYKQTVEGLQDLFNLLETDLISAQVKALREADLIQRSWQMYDEIREDGTHSFFAASSEGKKVLKRAKDIVNQMDAIIFSGAEGRALERHSAIGENNYVAMHKELVEKGLIGSQEEVTQKMIEHDPAIEAVADKYFSRSSSEDWNNSLDYVTALRFRDLLDSEITVRINSAKSAGKVVDWSSKRRLSKEASKTVTEGQRRRSSVVSGDSDTPDIPEDDRLSIIQEEDEEDGERE